jgi:hypothetical protein
MVSAGKSIVCAALTGFVFLGFTGCMTSPYHNQQVGNINNEINFSGYLLEPGRAVNIYAKDRQGFWRYIGRAESSQTGYQVYGKQWYPWNTDLVVPRECWRPTSWWNPDAIAEIRPAEGTKPMYTWEEDFEDIFDPDIPLEVLWEDYGHDGNTVVIKGLQWGDL